MKIYKKWKVLISCILVFSAVACSDFLDEDPLSVQTANSYYVNEEGFEDLVRAAYPLWRDIIQDRTLVLRGTDMFSAGTWDDAATNQGQGPPEDAYDTGFGAGFEPLGTLWNLLYREINRANTVIDRADAVVGMDDGLKNIRVAEAKVLRSLALFYAVQQWGDIPMPLTETTVPDKEVIKVAAADVYSQLIADLTAAETVLPKEATDYGRVTKGTAQFLLARVYLTRGWNFNNSLGGSNVDFDMALDYADKVIAEYPLAADYTDLFPQRNDNPLLETNNPGTQNAKNEEIVFAVQFNTNDLTNAGDDTNANSLVGNDYHSIFGGGADDVPGAVARSGLYNRHLNKFNTTPAIYRLFDPEIDSRYNHNFLGKLYALKDASGFSPVEGGDPIDIKQGDVVLEFRPWNSPALTPAERGLDVGGSLPYSVINTDEYGRIDASKYHDSYKAPMMWKFWEPGIPYGDGGGTFDFALFRSAEAYLIAAEAIVKGATGGSLGSADVYYNRIVDRALGSNAGANPLQASVPEDVSSLASKSYRATGATIDIDMILDERARELMGEYVRWYDLKRTGKLIERANKYNPWTAASGSLDEHHLLRPIPQQEIDLSSNNLGQNPGY
ncbi:MULTISPECIES: RagB/SusD family nutrient uptake outer membrane protein [unclassified Arenibacter]|uniref:RagB/SusD family nutrient uptake outer membrane protein n=1 Tax=unclassified Arenibacter TaxID=2615047 RepID=UPI000E340A1B|nr:MULTISPECIES: RagB/SusD family nutrient uptake outer membrane protein [unclassified Arenibacter]MCM4164577.1 RagB/SusD family nutrient uptake outer membrane protein [Arenibacter sp. A80]RFT55661.1 RagB/SusD family nutrient uptake outer membrane protein [Arenibacter sp. P308M17]